MSKRAKPETEELIPELIRMWRKLTSTSGPPDQLQTREFRRVAAVTSDIISGRDPYEETKCLSAYLLYLWPMRYQEAFSILSEVPGELGHVLDVHSGPGAAGLAAMKLGAASTTLMHPNLRVAEVGAEIAGRQGYTCTLKKGTYRNITGKFDTIILSHNLFSLGEEPLSIISKLQSHLTANGHLVLIESSQDLVNRKMLRIRDTLVQKGVAVQAPCVWKGSCPALTNKFPCFAQREMEKPYLIKELQRKLEIKLSSLKMSYLIIKNKESVWPKLPENQEFYRVVSPRFETEEGTVVYLCGTPGKRKLFSRLPEPPPSAKAFKYLRRGDLITIEGTAGTSALQLLENSEVKIASACGKPLPEVL